MAGDAICLAALPLAVIHAGLAADLFVFLVAAVGVGTVISAIVGGARGDRGTSKLKVKRTSV